MAKNRIRFVTAASLFDGHDASINIMRRILQSSGAEVIHLGHNRSVGEIVNAAIEEDVQGIAISSYQGGHVEFFKYVVDLLKKNHASHIKVFGGGGGTITPQEIAELEKYGVAKIFSPEDGRRLGLQGIIDHMIQAADVSPLKNIDWPHLPQFASDRRALAQALTCVEVESFDSVDANQKREIEKINGLIAKRPKRGVVIGMTGTGGAGKSSLTDELISRILEWDSTAKVAVLAVDPTRRKTGGALLGDRLRMNSLKSDRAYMRSYATREANVAISRAAKDAITLLRSCEFDYIFLETGGIGQSDTSIIDIVDVNIYVMTSEFGAPTQLEKINMLDYADLVLINKFEKSGSLDALTEVRKAFRRNHREFERTEPTLYPIVGTIASRFGDVGVDVACQHLLKIAREKQKRIPLERPFLADEIGRKDVVPRDRTHYLAEIAKTVREYKNETRALTEKIAEIESLEKVTGLKEVSPTVKEGLLAAKKEKEAAIPLQVQQALESYADTAKQYLGDEFKYEVRGREVCVPQTYETLSHNKIRKVVPPHFSSKADLLKFLRLENLPGHFPFTAGVFPFKRAEEDPKRMFAGEGTPERTNRRFHFLCQNEKAKRLSTAFDSVTLYGHDPDERPDIYGKIGESGVSICTLDDMKKLYAGFDLCDPNTSVSMTINGPAPILLGFFFNTAIDQQIERFEKTNGRPPSEEERLKIKQSTLEQVRGTVQADILKEDQAQNTCIFSVEFALRMMGDIQEYFVQHRVRNYYSVSISGYHIAEAGANPISQLAFTLANGFTFVEYYQARGMNVDDFVPNFSFFFSNGLDPEYTVIGRVARRIWAIAMQRLYGANERSQKLKYHIQTSGRSLHAQEIQFNDIRTTLQALLAFFDNCNSLHTNAYDEAVTTPTAESVRRAMAIQLILAKEFGWAKNENPLQGSYFVEELTEIVEEAVLAEFERISARGGVLGAMETQYQRSRIQEESLYYERLKHSGEFPIIGVNAYLNPEGDLVPEFSESQLTRATTEEKQAQIRNLRAFQKRHEAKAKEVLAELKRVAREKGNLFEALLEATRYCSLGQITQALSEVGGEYRRSV